MTKSSTAKTAGAITAAAGVGLAAYEINKRRGGRETQAWSDFVLMCLLATVVGGILTLASN